MNTSPAADDAAVDAAIAAMATPVAVRPSLSSRCLSFAGELTNSRRQVVLCATWSVALVGCVLLCALRSARTVSTALGPVHAKCGLDAFVGGAPNRAVATACRDAMGIRLAFFLPATLVVVAGLVLAVLVAIRRSQEADGGLATVVTRLRRSRTHAVLIALGVLALPVALCALRPATVERTSGRGIVTAHCGVDAYLFGYPDATIDRACHRVYGGRGALLAGSAAFVALGAGATLHLVLAGRGVSRRRLVLLGLSAGSAVVALAAMRPVDVAVRRGAAPVTARCGFDTYVVGHPDPGVQSACRRHLSKEAGTIAAATALAAVAFAASRLEPRIGARPGSEPVPGGAPQPT